MQVVELEEVRHRAKKNTRKWCKGKVGVNHDFDLVETRRYFASRWTVKTFVCQNCGKKDIDFSK